MQKGSEATSSRLFKRDPSLRYHVAHKGSRYYLCGCSPGIRINGVKKHCFIRRGKLTTRWPVYRSTTTLWFRTRRNGLLSV